MTDKERLEEVVKNVVFLQCGLTGAPMGVELPEDDYWYLYEQAEQVQELEQQIKRYREALEAIAYFDDKEEGEATTRIDVKYIARKALEG